MHSDHPIYGSQRSPIAGATQGAPCAPELSFEVTVIVRRADYQGTHEALAAGTRVSAETFADLHGASAADIEAVCLFARAQGLEVRSRSERMRRVILAGTTGAMCAAFGVALQHYTLDARDYRGRAGSVFVPRELAEIVEAVMGLDNRPQALPHFRVFDAQPSARPDAASVHAKSVAQSYSPVEVAHLYDFPTTGATGQTIGIIELGGGFRPTDIATYFAALKVQEPDVVAVLVDGATNHPSNSNGADGEVMLDIEVAAAVAPGARIAVYFTPNTDAGFLNAVLEAIHDSTEKPSVLSISWGSAESQWTGQAMAAMDAAFQDAALLGITVCVASGDGGSSDGVGDGEAHVDFPASSPHALACGGTRLNSAGAKITSETVWNSGADGGASGGGVSTVFARPAWQANAGVPAARASSGGRGVPDVSGDADPASGYAVLVDGQRLVIGGTSAVAPLWAGLVALFNAQLPKPAGLLQPALYGLGTPTPALHDITTGDNGAFRAGPGWDACTGLGTPNGIALLAALAKSAAAR